MQKNQSPSFLIIGLALFAMFFGAGNLIFPLFIGQLAQGEWIAGSLGFLITAVLVPFLGVIAMVVYHGNYRLFFDTLGQKCGFLAIFLLLTVWIPLGSGPRCITLAYASLSAHTTALPLWAFSLLYCIAISAIIYKKKRMLDLLGYVLTPLLLGCLSLIVYQGFNAENLQAPSAYTSSEMVVRGLKEGYNTMDLIASFFFSASIIEILRQCTNNDSQALLKTFKASIFGIAILGIVYVGLITLAVSHADILETVPKEKLLVHIAKTVLGAELGAVASATVCLACLTTSVALGSVFASFLSDHVFKNQQSPLMSVLITHVAVFGMSIFGLQGITFVTEPILQLFYPLLIVLIIFNVGRHFLKPAPLQELPDNS